MKVTNSSSSRSGMIKNSKDYERSIKNFMIYWYSSKKNPRNLCNFGFSMSQYTSDSINIL